jgi:hypothetical protein
MSMSEISVLPNPGLRQDRVRKFLITHAILCAVALLACIVETIAGVQERRSDNLRSYLIPLLAGSMTILGVRLYRRPRLTNYVAPFILAVDSVIVMVQMVWERGLESGWAASPILLTVLMPLYTDDRRVVLGLTGFQFLLYVGVFGARALGWLDYTQRDPDPANIMYSAIGYAFMVVGAAIFAGQASLDVLNSQERLQREVDQATGARCCRCWRATIPSWRPAFKPSSPMPIWRPTSTPWCPSCCRTPAMGWPESSVSSRIYAPFRARSLLSGWSRT